MNSMQLKDKIKNISNEKNVDFNTLLRLYMYDRFLERLSKKHLKSNKNQLIRRLKTITNMQNKKELLLLALVF